MPGEVFAAAAPAALIIGAFLVGVDALPCNGALFMLLRFDGPTTDPALDRNRAWSAALSLSRGITPHFTAFISISLSPCIGWHAALMIALHAPPFGISPGCLCMLKPRKSIVMMTATPIPQLCQFRKLCPKQATYWQRVEGH